MNKVLAELFSVQAKKFSDLRILSLTTADGLTIHCEVRQGEEVESEKIAAVASSLISLSNAAARQMIGKPLESTTIETTGGNIFLCNTTFEEKKCVLCIVTGQKENIGHVRYFTQQIAQLISRK